jgi:hypothetical protein
LGLTSPEERALRTASTAERKISACACAASTASKRFAKAGLALSGMASVSKSKLPSFPRLRLLASVGKVEVVINEMQEPMSLALSLPAISVLAWRNSVFRDHKWTQGNAHQWIKTSLLINGSKRLSNKTIPQVKRVARIFHQPSCHQRKRTFEFPSPAKPRAHQTNKTPNNQNHDAHLNAPEITLCKQL